MIFLRMDTRAKNLEAISRTKKRFEEALNRQYRKRVYAMFKDLLMVSPQYSGDFVSNWHVMPDTTTPKGYKEWREKLFVSSLGVQQAKAMGDPAAINFALTRAKFVQFTYLQKVYFINEAPLEFTATTVTADGVTHNLRPVNLMSPPQQMFSYLRSKYPASK